MSDADTEVMSLATEDTESIMGDMDALCDAHVMERGDLESIGLPSASDCRGQPLQMVIERCLWDRLGRHCQAVSRRCVAKFFETDGLNLQGYVMALDRLFLMSHSDLLADFRHQLFDVISRGVMLPSSSEATEWLRRSLIAASHLSRADELATAIFLHSFPGRDKPALDSLQVEVMGATHSQDEDDGVETDEEGDDKTQVSSKPEAGKSGSYESSLYPISINFSFISCSYSIQ